MRTHESGYIHPLVHVNRSAPDLSIPPCYDCGAQVDDYYTEPNRCGSCNALHRASTVTRPNAAAPDGGEA